MLLHLRRHAPTAGNLESRLIGRWDLPLATEGRELARRYCTPGVERVYTSDLSRTQETATLIYPGARLIPLPGLGEMDFGVFEGKLHAELQDNPDYQAWLSSNCHLPCPGGEGLTDFSHRVRTTFLGILAEELARRSAMVRLVVHAGVIMALLAGLARPKRDFTAWQAGFCGGFLLRHQPAAGNRPLGLLARLEGRE